jgi:Rrf2 family protein
MLSNSSKYALKAVVYIVTKSSSINKLLVKEIAENTKVPKPFLSKILQQLAANDLLSSTKGPHGGFFISKKQLENTVMDLVIVTEGRDKLQECILNFENCNSQNQCPVHSFIAPAKEALRKSLQQITLKELKELGNFNFIT